MSADGELPPRMDGIISGASDERAGTGMYCGCPRCGLGEILLLPVSIAAFCAWAGYFAERHRHCKLEVE